MLDELLRKRGLSYEDLTNDERETLVSLFNASNQKQLSVDRIRSYIRQMRYAVEIELSSKKEVAPQGFLSFICFLIPIVGIIRKWYWDQEDVRIKARLQVYMLLDTFISTSEEASKQLNVALSNIPTKEMG